MAVRISGRSEKIVQAAVKLFAHQGYHGTSTREIAHLANVSENTIFRHFENKEALFMASLRDYMAGITLRRDLLQGIERGEALEVVLPKIIELLTETINFKPELPRLIAILFVELNWKSEAFCKEHLSPILVPIHRYLTISIERGEARKLNSFMTTSALTSMVLMHPGLSRLIRDGSAEKTDSRKEAKEYTQFWADILSPRLVDVARPSLQLP